MITTEAFNAAARSNVHDPATCPWCKDMFKSINDSGKSWVDNYIAGLFQDVKDAQAKAAKVKAEAELEAKLERGRDRENLNRAFAGVEAALQVLPETPDGIAGYLQAMSYRGGVKGDDNALSELLGYSARARLVNGPVNDERLTVYVQDDGIILEISVFQLAIQPSPAVTQFLVNLKDGRYPKLISNPK